MKQSKVLIIAIIMAIVTSLCIVTVFATTERATAPSMSIKTTSLELENAVFMNFKVQCTDIANKSSVKLLVWESYPGEYIKGTEDAILSVKKVESNTGYLVFQYTDLAAKDMTKFVYVCAYANVNGQDYYSKPTKFSIIQYAYNAQTNAKLKPLVDSMLVYGAAAQEYFNYKTDFLATDPIVKVKVVNGTHADGFKTAYYQTGKQFILTADAPATGMVFSHWENSAGATVGTNKNLTITANKEDTYTAVYRTADVPNPTYSVTFLDYNGTVLKTESVESGKSATAPSNPTRSGYIFSGWDKAFDRVTSNLTVTATYTKITSPTIVVDSVTANAGDTVEVAVNISNNPGVAGAKFILTYDSNLTLTSAIEGDAFSSLDYTAPAALISSCPFNWDTLDAESNVDGAVLILTFKVSNQVTRGESLNVSISYSMGDVYDVDLNDVTLDIINGKITIK